MEQNLEKPSKIITKSMRITNKRERKGQNYNSATNNKSGTKQNETKV